ncbi:hypothetical protein EYZ11_010050 [Aspergillus tanneri]|uniref:Uncharacterized protein n=1 Tax=Aspergillus tanneri TaxID=1220188 RepID=A0A4S3J6B3_9EURO|nr:uncharacterized protein ATNIH1004_007623 [Aspergillus tanneri]KAA8646197.1 hypothetical protein ATNIH1004_007623 [Aspergillus tanneri]THC90486.1 hypothetical protein EYZ11_010050 [Aspergillus tanneri]
MEDIRPTARWANRMLRPLTSVYYRLQKHHEIQTSVADAKLREKSGTRDTVPTQPSKPPETEQGCSYSDEEPGDPAWIPGKPEKRRLRHNYSSRGRKGIEVRRRSRLSIHSPELHKTLPGAIEIATPLITGTAQRPQEVSSFRKQLFRNALPPADPTTSSDQRKTARTNHSNFPSYQGSWKQVLDLSGDAGLVHIAHSLDRIFLKLLHRTRIDEPNRGTRSLLSMTVRRLPEFIAEEQKIQDEADGDKDVDMCDAYFTELEAHYAPGGNGWQPFREAVRARGIHLVSDMVQKGWITKLAACRLLEECMGQGEYDAFELLMSRYLVALDTYEYPTAFDSHRPLSHCDDPVHILGVYYLRSTGRRSFVFDELSRLLLCRVFPAEWMVTTLWKRCVDGAIKSLSTGDGDSAAATRLIEAVILSAGAVYHDTEIVVSSVECRECSRSTRTSTNMTALPTDSTPCPIPLQDGLSNLVSSLVTALCGMCVARSQASGAIEKASGEKVRCMVERLAISVQRTIGVKPLAHGAEGPTARSLRCTYVLIGDYFLRCGQDLPSTEIFSRQGSISRRNFESFFLSLASQHDMVKELAELVRQVFHCCRQVRKGDKSRTPREVRDRVSQLTQLTRVQGASLLLGKVAAETAMGLAEMTLDPDDHAWAMEVQEQVVALQRGQKVKQYPRSTHVSDTGLYRWEESISEWVASTPAPKTRAVYVNLSSKPLGQPASTIASSTNSTSSSPSESGETASSITSSTPSVTTKRPCGSADRAPKRLRSTPEERNAGAAKEWPRLPLSLLRTSSSESDGAPIAARTRTAQALKESGPAPTTRSPQGAITTRIQVVIVHRKSEGATSNQSAPSSSTEPIGPRTRSAHKVCNTPDVARAPRRSLRAAARASRGRMRRELSSTLDEDSDDELSFV